ncbi:MAG: serine hydrolase [Eubacteriales bacterium]|nr:serine hydrolase [Eubacteriales bacterium]
MYKKILRTTAISLAAMLVFSQAAFADTVTASSPSAGNTASGTAASSGITTAGAVADTTYSQVFTFTTNSNGTKAGIISQTGPTGTKDLTSEGYLIIGADDKSAYNNNSAMGPGGSMTASASTSTASGSTTAAAAAPSTVNTNTGIAQPAITAEAAVLYDATTNQILFQKNGTASMYPASTTKLLTALLVAERLNMADTITFNASAVNNLESGAVTVDMKAGDRMTVKDAMYAMLLKSACDVANGLAEAVSGSQSAFAELMNQRARELGCTGSSFVNASGLNSTSHYTTAVDMAIITAAALNNAEIRNILQQTSYTLPATSSRGSLTIQTGNKMANGGTQAYPNYIGGKTGYTSKALNCLAGGISYNGHTLIAVVLKANQSHYEDSKKLFEYGKQLIGANASAGTASTVTTAASATASVPGSTVAASAAQTTTTASGKWEQLSNGTWKYKKADGSYCTNEWLDVNGNTYFFGSDSIMCTGWKQFSNSAYYYFNPENGAMVSGKWVTQNNKSYYLQANGVMATNTTIDGKYRVDANGVYVEKVG